VDTPLGTGDAEAAEAADAADETDEAGETDEDAVADFLDGGLGDGGLGDTGRRGDTG